LVQSATALANTLRDIINDRGLYKNIQGKNFVLAEGWVTLAAMCGMIAREVGCDRDETGAYVAVVSLVRITDGKEMTRASAECGGEGDKIWADRPAYARRSMAITRATGKACRIALSWIMNLAGFMPTPAEEMQDVERQIAERAKAPPKAEEPLPKVRMIGETDRKMIFGIANARAKEVGDPSIKADTIVRDIGKAWNLPENEEGQPSTKHIPAKLAQAFMEQIRVWTPGDPQRGMPEDF
jgi:hypothetical protein